MRTSVLPKMEKDAPIRDWIVGDTGIPKKGRRARHFAHYLAAAA
jgi:SRSO17 transposase